ncbi:hypothetical protein D9M68_731480 [compost metagenome]
MDDCTGGVGFQRDYQHPEPPVQPADGEAGPVADGTVGVGGEGTAVGLGHGHFGQHAHDQHHQRARDQVGNHHGGAGFGDGVAGADEQTGTDGAGNGEHGDMTIFQALGEPVGRGTAHALPIATTGGKRGIAESKEGCFENPTTCAGFCTQGSRHILLRLKS